MLVCVRVQLLQLALLRDDVLADQLVLLLLEDLGDSEVRVVVRLLARGLLLVFLQLLCLVSEPLSHRFGGLASHRHALHG